MQIRVSGLCKTGGLDVIKAADFGVAKEKGKKKAWE